MTVFEAEMRFFNFERFVNPARDAFPSVCSFVVVPSVENSREGKKRSREKKRGQLLQVLVHKRGAQDESTTQWDKYGLMEQDTPPSRMVYTTHSTERVLRHSLLAW